MQSSAVSDGIPVTVKSVEHDRHRFTFSYVPQRVCSHKVHVMFGGSHVASSPYSVSEHSYCFTNTFICCNKILNFTNTLSGGIVTYISEFLIYYLFSQVFVANPTRCPVRAYGPGLEGGIAQLPAEFTVETNGETEKIGARYLNTFWFCQSTRVIQNHSRAELLTAEQLTCSERNWSHYL